MDSKDLLDGMEKVAKHYARYQLHLTKLDILSKQLTTLGEMVVAGATLQNAVAGANAAALAAGLALPANNLAAIEHQRKLVKRDFIKCYAMLENAMAMVTIEMKEAVSVFVDQRSSLSPEKKKPAPGDDQPGGSGSRDPVKGKQAMMGGTTGGKKVQYVDDPATDDSASPPDSNELFVPGGGELAVETRAMARKKDQGDD